MKAQRCTNIIAHCMAAHKHRDTHRPANIQTLFEHLQDTYEYPHSYRSVVRFVRKHYPAPRIRPHRRVELPAGCLAQVDWLEQVKVMLAGTEATLHASS